MTEEPTHIHAVKFGDKAAMDQIPEDAELMYSDIQPGDIPSHLVPRFMELIVAAQNENRSIEISKDVDPELFEIIVSKGRKLADAIEETLNPDTGPCDKCGAKVHEDEQHFPYCPDVKRG